MNIHFEKATQKHLDIIYAWLAQDFVAEFWDNTQAHKDDIVNFIEGRKTSSNYANGKYIYWLATCENEPFAMLMAIQETYKDDIGKEKLEHLSKTGHTYGIDYMIGNSKFFGKGYGAETLAKFIDFFRENVDPKADTFLIDPDYNNPRAKHVYIKAGFKHVGDFLMEGNVSGAGKFHHLLIKKFNPAVSIIKANIDDYPIIANMSKFYALPPNINASRREHQHSF
jgi:RimJ/RimL family protein N-acetyltransferase